jgi:integrase/recombinase XerD
MAPKKGFAAVTWLRERTTGQKGGNQATPLPDTGEAADALSACARRWLEALEVRRIATRTLDERRFCLRTFITWALERDVKRAGEVTRPILEAYQRTIFRYRQKNGKPLSWSAQRERLRCLMDWFRWLTRQNILMHNPASELELPRPEKRLPVAGLTPAEIARLLAVPDLADPLGLRDRAMLEVLYATGIRRAELARLECADANLGRGTLTVRQGKGGKDRVVPLGPRAAGWVARYLDEVRPRLTLDAREPGLFLTGYGEPFNPDVLTRMMTAWMKSAGLAGRGSCHLLRHTCATHMLENGADVRYIQQLLGHANLETTAIYTEVTITQLLAVHARCHPSAQPENPTTLQNAASVAS